MADYDLYADPLTGSPLALFGRGVGDIYVLDRGLNRIGLVSEYNALVWTSRIWDHSEAHLKCNPGSIPDGAAFLQRSDSAEAMFITRRHEVSTEKERYTEIECKGATILLKRRVVWWTHTYEGVNLAVAAGELVTDAQATYQGIVRTIPCMGALYDLTGTPHLITKQVSWGDTAEAIYEMARAAAFSFGVRYSPGGLQPFVRRGVDLSASVVFSTAYDDVVASELDYDEADRANVAVVGGLGEGLDRVVTTHELDDGRELAEVWVDANGVSDEDLTPEQYLAALQQHGAEKVADLPVTFVFDAKVTSDRHVYGRDYQLGDTIAYRAFGIEGTDIISEVTETFEKGEHGVEIALGSVAPTIRKVIR